MGRPAANAGRQLTVIGVLAALVAFGCPVWADTGWFGERVPEALRVGTSHGDYVHGVDAAAMVYVPAGYFLRGTTKAEAEALSDHFGDFFGVEMPQRSIYLPAYYVDKFEVTNRQYGVFLGALERGDVHTLHRNAPPDKNYTPTYWRDSRLNGPEHPVTAVDWYDAYAYCRWAGKELPTEAQWEKAARGNDGRRYPWGEEMRRDRTALQNGSTVPVGSRPCPECAHGLLEMSGNVWEWTQSPFQPYPFDEGDRGDMDADALWVMRGGSFTDPARNLRTTTRGGADPGARRPFIGFRVALSPPRP